MERWKTLLITGVIVANVLAVFHTAAWTISAVREGDWIVKGVLQTETLEGLGVPGNNNPVAESYLSEHNLELRDLSSDTPTTSEAVVAFHADGGGVADTGVYFWSGGDSQWIMIGTRIGADDPSDTQIF